METPTFDMSAARAELESELAVAIAELEPLRAAWLTTKTSAEDANWRFEVFVQRYNAATRHGADEASPALIALLHSERQARDLAHGAAEKARRALRDGNWIVDCIRAGLDQLDRLENPPPVVRREVVKRPPPDLGSYDPIKMPAGAVPAESAT
jgi:hypothetical protein